MKIGGIVLVVFGVLNFIVAIIASSQSAPEDIVTQKFGAAIILSVLGAFLMSRAKAKETKNKEKDEWNK